MPGLMPVSVADPVVREEEERVEKKLLGHGQQYRKQHMGSDKWPDFRSRAAALKAVPRMKQFTTPDDLPFVVRTRGVAVGAVV